MNFTRLRPIYFAALIVFVTLILLFNASVTNSVVAAATNFNVQISVSSAQVLPGNTITNNLIVRNVSGTSLSTVTVLTIFDPTGKQVYTKNFTTKTFPANETRNFTSTFTLPLNLVAGKYTEALKVRTPDEKVIYYYNGAIASFSVTKSSPTATPTPVITPTPTPTPTTPVANPGGKLIFGIGTEADGAALTRLAKEAPVKMLTSWYNRPGDLAWMTGWRNSVVPDAYARGYSLHLIVYSDDPAVQLNTGYGPACGKAYPLSSRFIGDMTQLAQTYAGNGTVYVTFFSEFQTYSCVNNQWVGNENYFRALKDQYMAALRVFHQYAPNSKVSLGWGGWQASFDEPAKGGGRSMFPYFADVMRASDFQSFQAMRIDSNVSDVREMTKTLGAYGPVMLAHIKPNNGNQQVFDNDVRTMLTDSFISEVTSYGLFAWSFMDNVNLSNSESTYQFVKNAVIRYAR